MHTVWPPGVPLHYSVSIFSMLCIMMIDLCLELLFCTLWRPVYVFVSHTVYVFVSHMHSVYATDSQPLLLNWTRRLNWIRRPTTRPTRRPAVQQRPIRCTYRLDKALTSVWASDLPSCVSNWRSLRSFRDSNSPDHPIRRYEYDCAFSNQQTQ